MYNIKELTTKTRKRGIGSMFREMRRKNQALSLEECIDILERGTSGVLAVAGDDGYPYAVPLSYVFDKKTSKLYFHGARKGHKLDAVKRENKASFCVIHQDNVKPEEYTTYYKSVIVFGKMHILEEEPEKYHAIDTLGIKYAPLDSEERRREFIQKEYKVLCMMEMQIEHMTGKEAIELAVQKK
jgi:nitroimidazol reductase NimA-like FMN-containing flavoprotein (pyridoxamine 5'-phosphate oxidase superfamily)